MTASLAYQLKKAPARVFIAFVILEMFGQAINPLRQESYLDFGRPRVSLMPPINIHDRVFFTLGQSHDLTSPSHTMVNLNFGQIIAQIRFPDKYGLLCHTAIPTDYGNLN